MGTIIGVLTGVCLLLFGSTVLFAWLFGEEMRENQKYHTAVTPPELDWDWDYTRERGWVEDENYVEDEN